jgi:DNA-binding SARP family transcriptional activator/ABC-type branched-subunit amino acid transport system substrate-binding protein/streptogramin lyase
LVEFRVLGPLSVVDRGNELALGAAKQRALLALLLLHRNELVASERLIDWLWAGKPPPSAQKSLQVYVSGLRKALGDGRLETAGRAYRLRVDERELDLDQFEDLIERAQEAEPQQTAELLREALGLYRGEPFAELRYEQFAQAEIARLEEMYLQTLEQRIDADLACGKEQAVLPELEALVSANPLRERLRAQLMLALYRCGRQADALAVYRQGRDLLDEQLGLEPGPELRQLERQILAQDPVLAAPASKPLVHIRGERRRRLLVLVAGGALIVVAAVAAAVVLATRGGGARLVTAAGNSLAAIDPKTGRIVADFPVGRTPTTVSLGQGTAWVLNADDRTVSRIDPRTGDRTTFATGATPIDLAAGNAGVWVGNGVRRPESVLPVLTSVSSLDPAHPGSILRTVPLPVSTPYLPSIVVGERAVWAISQDNDVFRIDPHDGKVVAHVSPPGLPIGLALGAESVWVVTGDGHVDRIDPRTNRVTFTTKPAASGLSDLTVGAGVVWASDPYDGTVWRIDPTPPTVTRTISVPKGTDQVAFGAGSLWAVDSVGGTMIQINPHSNRITRTISIGNTPRGIAFGHGLVWVTVDGATSTSLPAAFHSNQSSNIALPSTSCGDVVYGGTGSPQYLIASDFPLQAGPQAPTLAMSQAVEYVLRQHHFRAARYRIAFQSCDDSTAQSGNDDPAKCAEEAKLMATNPHVLGVVGPYDSTCAEQEIPIANRASLAIVSPAASISALTRTPPGARSQLAALYPTGRRTFFRVNPADDSEAAALALLAKELGTKNIYVLLGGPEYYGRDITPWFAPAARKLGLTIAGYTTWNPFPKHAATRAAIVDRVTNLVKRSHADAVYFAGYIFDGRIAGQIIKQLRHQLGPRTPLIADDGFLNIPLLFQRAGPSARGVYLAAIGSEYDQLPPDGKRFLKQFAAS